MKKHFTKQVISFVVFGSLSLKCNAAASSAAACSAGDTNVTCATPPVDGHVRASIAVDVRGSTSDGIISPTCDSSGSCGSPQSTSTSDSANTRNSPTCSESGSEGRTCETDASNTTVDDSGDSSNESDSSSTSDISTAGPDDLSGWKADIVRSGEKVPVPILSSNSLVSSSHLFQDYAKRLTSVTLAFVRPTMDKKTIESIQNSLASVRNKELFIFKNQVEKVFGLIPGLFTEDASSVAAAENSTEKHTIMSRIIEAMSTVVQDSGRSVRIQHLEKILPHTLDHVEVTLSILTMPVQHLTIIAPQLVRFGDKERLHRHLNPIIQTLQFILRGMFDNNPHNAAEAERADLATPPFPTQSPMHKANTAMEKLVDSALKISPDTIDGREIAPVLHALSEKPHHANIAKHAALLIAKRTDIKGTDIHQLTEALTSIELSRLESVATQVANSKIQARTTDELIHLINVFHTIAVDTPDRLEFMGEYINALVRKNPTMPSKDIVAAITPFSTLPAEKFKAIGPQILRLIKSADVSDTNNFPLITALSAIEESKLEPAVTEALRFASRATSVMDLLSITTAFSKATPTVMTAIGNEVTTIASLRGNLPAVDAARMIEAFKDIPTDKFTHITDFFHQKVDGKDDLTTANVIYTVKILSMLSPDEMYMLWPSLSVIIKTIIPAGLDVPATDIINITKILAQHPKADLPILGPQLINIIKGTTPTKTLSALMHLDADNFNTSIKSTLGVKTTRFKLVIRHAANLINSSMQDEDRSIIIRTLQKLLDSSLPETELADTVTQAQKLLPYIGQPAHSETFEKTLSEIAKLTNYKLKQRTRTNLTRGAVIDKMIDILAGKTDWSPRTQSIHPSVKSLHSSVKHIETLRRALTQQEATYAELDARIKAIPVAHTKTLEELRARLEQRIRESHAAKIAYGESFNVLEHPYRAELDRVAASRKEITKLTNLITETSRSKATLEALEPTLQAKTAALQLELKRIERLLEDTRQTAINGIAERKAYQEKILEEVTTISNQIPSSPEEESIKLQKRLEELATQIAELNRRESVKQEADKLRIANLETKVHETLSVLEAAQRDLLAHKAKIEREGSTLQILQTSLQEASKEVANAEEALRIREAETAAQTKRLDDAWVAAKAQLESILVRATARMNAGLQKEQAKLVKQAKRIDDIKRQIAEVQEKSAGIAATIKDKLATQKESVLSMEALGLLDRISIFERVFAPREHRISRSALAHDPIAALYADVTEVRPYSAYAQPEPVTPTLSLLPSFLGGKSTNAPPIDEPQMEEKQITVSDQFGIGHNIVVKVPKVRT